MPSAPELGMAVRPSRQQSQSQDAGRLATEHLGKQGRVFVIADHEIVARQGVDRIAGVAKMGVHHTRLVHLVVVDPQLNRRLRSGHISRVRAPRSRSYAGLGTGSEKHARNSANVAAVTSGSTTE